MKKGRFLVILFFTFLSAAALLPSLSMAGGPDPVAVPEELGGGYLITTEQALETGLVTAADAAAAATPHNLTVIISGTAGSIKSSPKGLPACVHTGDVTPTACGPVAFTAKGITLHAYPDPITSTASAILDWTAVTSTGTVDISKRCKHESPTCGFNLTEDMTVTATFGVDPVAKVTPVTDVSKPFKFGKVKVGKSKAVTFTVKNAGVTTLNISSIDVTVVGSPFSVPSTIDGKAANKCTAPLAPKKTCTFKVVFTPVTASTTAVDAIIAVASDESGSPENVYVQGIGN